jgi:hypothetical protein
MMVLFDPKDFSISFDEDLYVDIESYPEFFDKFNALQAEIICRKITDGLVDHIECRLTAFLQKIYHLGFLYRTSDLFVKNDERFILLKSNRIANSICWEFKRTSPKFRFVFYEETQKHFQKEAQERFGVIVSKDALDVGCI